MYQLKDFHFSKKFKFGVAEADLQVIGEKYTLKNENSEPTMWLNFSKNSPEVYKNQTPLDGIDRYNRWKEDVKIIKELKCKHYRTSISMARIMTRDRKPNFKAIDWYKTFFSYLRANNINIYATLYHWELPQYLADIGGWKNRDIIPYIVDYAKIAYKYLNEYIEEYFILNEITQATFYSYHLGEQAPGEKNLKGALTTVHHMLLAQGLVFQALKELNKSIKLSTVYNPSVTYALKNTPKDIQAAQYAYGYHTSMFTDPLYCGNYPDYMLSLFKSKMPKIEKNDMNIIKIGNGLYTFGVNYYRGKTVKYDPDSEVKFTEVRFPQGVKNGMGRPIYVAPTYPEGLYDLLCELYHRYESYGMKRIYITENGASWPDVIDKTGKIKDDFRIYFLNEHIKQVQKAILKGIPVKGYFVWALMDNYNWSAGYRPESVYGLVHIDWKTMTRTPKESYYWYKKLIRTGILD